jgi:hypothetical protein
MPVSIYFVTPNDPRICTVVSFEKRLIAVKVNILTHIESKSRMTFDILLKEYCGKIYHFGKKMQKIAKDVIFKF